MRNRRRSKPGGGGFTLIELLVVIFIILLVSAVTLPVIIPALNNRQVSEAARILQGSLAGSRDAAIRANAPRGIRLLPDPVLNTPATAGATVGTGLGGSTFGVLTYSRIVPIEPGPDYTDGAITIIGDEVLYTQTLVAQGITNTNVTTHPVYYSPYPSAVTLPNGNSNQYPPTSSPVAGVVGKVLRIEECAYYLVNGVPLPNAATNWWWNVRVGDKIQINNTGRFYTIVGPLTIYPGNSGGQNPELFVNDGPPGAQSNLVRHYPYQFLNNPYTSSQQANVEFLYVVNGQDDDGDGYIDNGNDGVDNNYINGVDDIYPITDTLNVVHHGEWEDETWLGSFQAFNNNDNPLIYNNDQTNPSFNLPYTIARRPVVSPNARETVLPAGVVIDATTWNNSTTMERSRLPIDPYSFYVDVLVDQSGQVIPTTRYSSQSSFPITDSFFHFWLSDRTDVYDPGTYQFPALPMPQGVVPSALTGPAWNPLITSTHLKRDRQLVTLFTKTGQITTKSLEYQAGNANYPTFHPPKLTGATDPGDVNAPYYEAQLGIKEAK